MFSYEILRSYSQSNSKPLADFTPGSDFLATWECENNHTYQMRLNRRVNGQGCPVCAGKQVLRGYNDFASKHPQIASEWNTVRNSPLTPETVTAGSDKKVWWVCEKGHEWETKISLRATGSQCPYCSRKKVLKGFNDLATTHPQLASEWHPTKNIFSPEEVLAGSRKKVWWKCEQNHEWETFLHSRGILGTKCPYCSGRKVSAENNIDITHPHLHNQWSPKNTSNSSEYTSGQAVKAWWVCEKGHEWETAVKNRTENKNCPECANSSFVSSKEKELAEFIKSITPNIVTNTKKVIAPFELDVHVPDQNIAIEFNGLYWHDENHKPKNYHYDKWLACKNQGIQLIQIWEDDWNRNPDLVKQMLTHKLRVTVQPKIYARETTISTVPHSEKQEFLNHNHIQRAGKGTTSFGLYQDTNLVAVMVITVKEQTMEIVRYATAQHVVGGFSKLLKHAITVYNPVSIYTYSDNMVSNGELYSLHGFVAEKLLPPDYMYVVNGERKHKFGYRLKKFRNNPNLQYAEGLTEKELAQLNNIPRIWDAGKIKWVKNLLF